MAAALLVAAGRGERLGGERPKALVELAGRPMLEWSLEALRVLPEVRRIVVALPGDELRAAPKGVVAVAGGAVRSESVRAALRCAGKEDPVIVHDAARPLAGAELFRRALEELRLTGADAVLAAAPVADTVKQATGGELRVARTIDRRELWAIQTPQAFRRAALERALGSASAEDLVNATDDAWLIERQGGDVRLLQTGEHNFKVTTAEDLRLAELVLRERCGAILQPSCPVAPEPRQ